MITKIKQIAIQGVFAGCLGVTLSLLLIGSVESKEFPTRPVEIIANFGPGGSADQAARAVSRYLPEQLGVPVPVTNITGASGNSGLTRLASSTPDGYTIGTFTGIAVTTMVTGISRLKLDQFKFLAIADAGTSMFFVGKQSPFQDFQGLLDYAKKHPGKVRVATAGFGTQDDIAVKAITKAGYPLINVPMKPGQRNMAVVGGHIAILFQQIDAVVSLVKSGDLKPIVVFADKRFHAFPDVPTAKEFGFSNLDLPNWRGLAAPAKTPEDRVKTLYSAMRRVLESKEYHAICQRQYKCVKPMNLNEIKEYVVDYRKRIADLMHE